METENRDLLGNFETAAEFFRLRVGKLIPIQFPEVSVHSVNLTRMDFEDYEETRDEFEEFGELSPDEVEEAWRRSHKADIELTEQATVKVYINGRDQLLVKAAKEYIDSLAAAQGGVLVPDTDEVESIRPLPVPIVWWACYPRYVFNDEQVSDHFREASSK